MLEPRRPTRVRRPPKPYDLENFCSTLVLATKYDHPRHVEEALESNEREQCKRAMDDEMDAPQESKIWILVELLESR